MFYKSHIHLLCQKKTIWDIETFGKFKRTKSNNFFAEFTFRKSRKRPTYMCHSTYKDNFLFYYLILTLTFSILAKKREIQKLNQTFRLNLNKLHDGLLKKNCDVLSIKNLFIFIFNLYNLSFLLSGFGRINRGFEQIQ